MKIELDHQLSFQIAEKFSIKPLPLALPCPAWHTAIAENERYSSRELTEFLNWLVMMSDAELVSRMASQRQWMVGFFFSATTGGRGVSDTMSFTDSIALHGRARAVEDAMESEALCRFKESVRKRKEACGKAAFTRRIKKGVAA